MHFLKQDPALVKKHEDNNLKGLLAVLEHLAADGTSLYFGCDTAHPDPALQLPWIHEYFAALLVEHLKFSKKTGHSILSAEPDELKTFVEFHDNFFKAQGLSVGARSKTELTFRKFCKKIFSYESVFSDGGKVLRFDRDKESMSWAKPKMAGLAISGWDYFNSFNIRYCPYCNAIPLNEDRRFKRTDFDHFYDHSAYPLLGISFYNLVPVCKNCNQDIKTREIPSGYEALNAFKRPDFHTQMKICYTINKSRLRQPDDINLTLASRRANGPKVLPGGADFLVYYKREYQRMTYQYVRHLRRNQPPYVGAWINRIRRFDRDAAVGSLAESFGIALDENTINSSPFSKLALDVLEAAGEKHELNKTTIWRLVCNAVRHFLKGG